MLVLRKEIKIGIGAGLTILGIAAVYGLIAALSGGSADNPKQQASANVSTDDKKGIGNGVDGLPPKVGEPDPVVTPPKPEPSGRDPFAESVRKDGNTATDPWATALSTGRVGGDGKAPAVIKSPTDAGKSDGKTDIKLVGAPKAGDPAKIVAPLDPSHKTPAKSDGTVAATGKYVVQSGDTFSTIANKHYGSKKYAAALIKANPDIAPNRLRPGKEINLPAKEQVASIGGSVGREPSELSGPIDASRQYRIAAGDTLTRISSKLYGTSTRWNDLYEANKAAIGDSPAKLRVGTLIDLPQKPNR